MAGTDLTVDDKPIEWNSKPMLQLPLWAEPVMVFSILFAAMVFTRRKSFSVFRNKKGTQSILDDPDMDSARSSDELLFYDPANENDAQDPVAASKHQPKQRRICGLVIETPNTSRFAKHIHSRVLQKFPFLIEMFYWVITYGFYRFTKVASKALFSEGVWDISQANALRILDFEQNSIFSFMFPFREHDVQRWFMGGHQDALTFLNRLYALMHIPGTVGFIAWYYYVAPNHNTFALIRRTLTLTNLFAFVIFVFYPCMPPRLLPEEYGFLDTVRHDHAESIWMSGDYVNSLAAMPSMHFGYSFVIGCTMVYHSGIFRRTLQKGEVRKSPFWKFWYFCIAIGYPSAILITIVATANHYWMDATVATFTALLAFLCNKIFFVLIPLEDLLIWALRLEKPIPSTGERFHQRGGRL